MKCCHQFGTKYTIPPKNFSEVVQGRAMYLRLFATRAKPNTSALHIFALPAGTLQYQIALHTKIITNTTLMKVIISFLTCNTTDTVRLHWRNQHIHAGLSRRGIDRAKTEERKQLLESSIHKCSLAQKCITIEEIQRPQILIYGAFYRSVRLFQLYDLA